MTDTHLIRKLSVEAAQNFPDGYFDFVYIDALHTYKASKEDIEAWWPKLRAGGLFAGDDNADQAIEWLYPRWFQRHFRWGVISSVNEFAAKHNLVLQITHSEVKYVARREFLGIANWYVIKPFTDPPAMCVQVVEAHSPWSVPAMGVPRKEREIS